MQIHEIATKTGQDSKAVAADLGMEWKQGVALRQIDDEQALAYIASKGEVEPASSETGEEQKAPQRVRFWTTKRKYLIPAGDKCGMIKFRDWLFESDAGSPEVAFMRDNRDYFIAQGVYEVCEKPHKDPMVIAEFMQAITGTIHTGPGSDMTPSREMRDSIKALLPADVASELSTAVKNSPRTLTRAVAEHVSLLVSEYQEKL